ncbi:hypothetical protein KVR01_003048 [Diaporthe batatas]|uniref:uncharacterized protein n=1 Tax=Diaporthe batatas TaxID=748121 RepID=UPI001D03E3D9|nr:uncharacterized protein KVR01_003048 [Diaporthe batatas]KAG8167359.1 hypothetical protein KVR01_003048 [Diaporthe batatas]
MSTPKAFEVLKARLCMLSLLTGACKCLFGSCTSLPGVLPPLALVIYTTRELIKINGGARQPPVPTPTPTPDLAAEDERDEVSHIDGKIAPPEDEVKKLAQALDRVEGLLEHYGDMVERTGTSCVEAFRQIHKQHSDQLKRYTDFRNEYDDKLGSVGGALDARRHETAEVSRTAAQNYSLLCDLIAKYQRAVEENQDAAKQHMGSVSDVLLGQDKAIAAAREHVTLRVGEFQAQLEAQERAAEENRGLVREYGADVNRVVSDHARLVGEYQAALEGVVCLNTANRVFSLVRVPYGWETLGDTAEDVEDHGGARSGAQPATATATGSMVDNVQELSRTFRTQSNQTANTNKATPQETPMEQMLADMLSQVQDTARAQRAEEAGQLRQAQADIEKLRADLGEIEEFRRVIRERQEVEELHQRQTEMLKVFEDDPERYHRDAKFRAEVGEIRGAVEERLRGARGGASSPGESAKPQQLSETVWFS